MRVQPDQLPWKDAYKIIVGSILPRPIALVSTISPDGVANLAPFSFFTAICADPFLVCFSPMRKGEDGTKKDTLNNIEATKEFVIHIVGEEIVEQMNTTAGSFPPDIDEFLEANFTKVQSHVVKPPRIKESRIHLECTLQQALHFGDHPGAGSLVIGKVEMVHIDDELYEKGRILTDQLKPVGRMAGHYYTRSIADVFELKRN